MNPCTAGPNPPADPNSAAVAAAEAAAAPNAAGDPPVASPDEAPDPERAYVDVAPIDVVEIDDDDLEGAADNPQSFMSR